MERHGGRAPEYLRYDKDLVRITRDVFAKNKPVASICHGIEILGAADVIRGQQVTTIPNAASTRQMAERPTLMDQSSETET